MASDSSRPGTSSGAVTSILSAGGIRGIRAVASESWDDDFLWQHSSSSDLHLPSTSTTKQHHSQRHSQYRDKRLSTASSSSEYYAPRTQVPYHHHAQSRPHRKASSLSTSTMGSSVFTQDDITAQPPLRTRLSRSTSSSHSQQESSRIHWASLSTTSLQEEEDEPTITLASIASRQTATSRAILASSNALKRPSTSPSPSPPPSSVLLHDSTSSELAPPNPSFFRTASTSSWRSTTPSLASDTHSANHTYESASATETDNETAEEGDTENQDNNNTTMGNWEHLSLSPEGQQIFSTSAKVALIEGQGSTVSGRRKRGRGRRNTFGANTPRLALSSLFGSPNHPSNTTLKLDNNNNNNDETPPRKLGASFFRRSNRFKKVDSSSIKTILASKEPTNGEASNTRQLQSHQHLSLTNQPELEAPLNNNKAERVRAPELMETLPKDASSTPVFLGSPAAFDAVNLSPGTRVVDLSKQASFERTPRSSNATQGSSGYSHRYSGISYNSTLSDRLRFQEDNSKENINEAQQSFSSNPNQAEQVTRNHLSPHKGQQADKSTTSLISNQSSATFTSTFSNESSNRPRLSRSTSMPRRKLKKARPQTADASTNGPSSSSSQIVHQSTLSPSFAFPASSLRYTTDKQSEKYYDTSAEAIESLSRKKSNFGMGSTSLRRRVSRRRSEIAHEGNSADEGGYFNLESRNMVKAPTLALAQNNVFIGQSTQSTSSLETAFASRTTIRQSWIGTSSEPRADGPKIELLYPDSGIHESHQMPRTALGRSTRLLAGLSKRVSRDFKVSKPNSPALERKRSVMSARIEGLGASGSEPTTNEDTAITLNVNTANKLQDTELRPSTNLKKHKRPLSLSGFLSRSTDPLETTRARSRSSTLTGNQVFSPLSHSVDKHKLARGISATPLSASVIGGFRRPSSFLHRSTASSGNIPTARALLDSTDSREGKRSSVDGPILSPPVLHHRRSFNPLWRTTTTTVPEERPGSSLSLLSETSTVRPLPALPSVPSTSTSYAYSEVAKIEVVNTAVDSPPTRLRQRHLPSLSLTLVSGRVTSSTPPRSAEPSFPAFSPRTMQRAHSENPTSGSQFSSLRSHYFTPVSSKAVSTSSSKTTSLANTPGGSSKKSADSDGSASIVRRVSLSDLKIPQRITNAQAKIGRDLKRVKEFKEGVDELKRLRKIYRGLLTSDQTTNRLSCSIDASEHTNDSSEDSSETSASPPPIPTDATARVDNLMARVAIDYQKWWEIADVLINLAEGAEDGQDGDGQGQRNSLSRERCRSEIVVPSIPDAARNGPTDSPLESQVSTAMASSILREKKTINSKNVVQTHSSLSPPSRNLLSTSVQRRAPHLIRSHSTSSLSPQGSSPATPARFTGHNAYTSFSEGITADGQHQSEESSSLSERQLQILRGMLDPHHSRRSPASPISTRSVDSSPARTPSITSISPRSHLFVNGLVPLSPFTSRESNNNRPRSSSSAFSSISASSTSSFVSPLRRRASAKKGHIIIKTVVDSDSRVEENDRLSFRGNSPIPDSPPFHVSNMLPTPMICTIGECTVDLPSNPQNYLITTTNTSPLSSTRRNTTDETPFSKIDNALSILGTSRPSTPPILRKSKFRQASRLGIIGIRDFWKTFNNGNNNSISSTRGNAMEGSTVLPSVEGNDNDALAEPSIIPTEKGNESDCSMVLESVQSENDAREREATASLGKKSRSQEEAVVEEKTQGKDTLSTKMGDGSSDDEDEDWDKRSSDEENNQLPRSDTQATVVPSSLPLQNRGTGDGLSNTASSTSEGVNHRSRTQSATSTASVGTVVHHPSPRMDTLSTGHSNERGSIEFKAGKPNARPTEDSLASSTSTSNPKLALTSEAMPALLAKVMEVKQHCATCVTELRNVTV